MPGDRIACSTIVPIARGDVPARLSAMSATLQPRHRGEPFKEGSSITEAACR